MPFQRELPEWKNEGQRPPESMLDKGWRPLDHPPADVFNWHWYLVYRALAEVHEIGATQEDVTAASNELKRLLKDFIDRRDNPHQITKTHVGLGNVDNYKQATKVEFDAHTNSKNNPHEVTTAQINVTNAKASNFSASVYPVGMSMFEITNVLGWPSAYGTIVTYKIDSSRTFQWFYDRGDSLQNQGVYFRTHHATPGWAEWSQLETVASGNTKLKAHTDLKNNPHGVTKAQVGLGNVDNTKQATKAEFDLHVSNQRNPHNVTSEQINVTSPVEAEQPGLNYPMGISMFQTANGVSLGYPANQIIVHTISQGAHRCFQYIYDASSGVDRVWYRTWRQDTGWKSPLENETTEGAQFKVSQHANNKNNPHDTTKAQVGLSEVDNVKQATKAEFDQHNTDNTRHINAAERNKWNAAEKNAKDASVAKTGDTMSGLLTLNRGLALGVLYTDVIGAIYRRDDVDDIRAKLARGWVSIETVDGAAAKLKEHADLKNNPHQVTKSQVGLGNVQNYPVSTQAQAEAGNHTTSFMTPERVKQFARQYGPDFDAFNGLALDHGAHKNNKNNPHDVTSKQINIIDFKPAKDSASTYPEGVSLHFISSHSNNTEGYPYGFGTVQTNRVHDSRTFQMFTGNGDRDESKNSWTRWAFENTWTEWVQTETSEGAKAKANQAETNAKEASISKTGDTMSGALTLNRGIVLGTTYADSVGALYRRTSEDDLRAKMARGWVSLETTEGAAVKVKAHADQKNNPHNVTSEQVNIIEAKRASDLASTYPMGLSLFSISRTNNDVTGFPFAFGTIQTNRVHNSRTFQIFVGNGDTEESKNSWIRWAFENSWTDWQEYMSADSGWVRLPLQNGVKLYPDSSGLFIRKVGKLVQLRGAVTNILGDSTSITTVPTQFRPASGRSLVGNTTIADGTAYFVRYHMSGHNGVFSMSRSSRGQAGYVDGIWWPLDFTWMVDD